MDDQVTTRLREGEAAAHKGNRAEARRAFRAVLIRDPGNVAALLWMAWLSHDPRASLVYVDRVLELDPDNARARAAHQWAQSRLRLPVQVSRFEGPQRRLKVRWRRLVPITALGSLGAFFAGMFLVLLWHSPQSLSIITALGATPSIVPEKTATPVPLASLTPTIAVTATPVATDKPTERETPTPLYTSSSPGLTPSPTDTLGPVQTSPVSTPDGSSTISSAVGDNLRWIDVDLSLQTLTAYEGQTGVRSTLVSTGLPGTATPVGQYHIYIKLLADDMRGPDYYLRDVPYTMYFYRGYGLHGTYWHSNFGHPMSHGCINLPTEEAKWLFDWASVGTLVNIHP